MKKAEQDRDEAKEDEGEHQHSRSRACSHQLGAAACFLLLRHTRGDADAFARGDANSSSRKSRMRRQSRQSRRWTRRSRTARPARITKKIALTWQPAAHDALTTMYKQTTGSSMKKWYCLQRQRRKKSRSNVRTD